MTATWGPEGVNRWFVAGFGVLHMFRYKGMAEPLGALLIPSPSKNLAPIIRIVYVSFKQNGSCFFPGVNKYLLFSDGIL